MWGLDVLGSLILLTEIRDNVCVCVCVQTHTHTQTCAHENEKEIVLFKSMSNIIRFLCITLFISVFR